MEPVIEFLSRLAVSTLQVIMGGHERFLTQNPDLWWVPTAIDLMIGIGLILIWYSDLAHELRSRASHTMTRVILFPLWTIELVAALVGWWMIHLLLTPPLNPLDPEEVISRLNDVLGPFVSLFALRTWVNLKLMSLNQRGRDTTRLDDGTYSGPGLNDFYTQVHTPARRKMQQYLRWGFVGVALLFICLVLGPRL